MLAVPCLVARPGIGAPENVARVCLVSADGVIPEDTVEEGVVLFQAEGPVGLSLSAELYDQAGKLVTEHVAICARSH